MENKKLLWRCATLGLIGNTGMPGTWASLFTATIFFIVTRFISPTIFGMSIAATSITVGASILLLFLDPVCDDRAIVLDEVAGMSWALLGAQSVPEYAAAFLLFRLFDITKVAGVSLWEKLPGAWGIMADDLWAALLTLAVMYGIPALNSAAGY